TSTVVAHVWHPTGSSPPVRNSSRSARVWARTCSTGAGPIAVGPAGGVCGAVGVVSAANSGDPAHRVGPGGSFGGLPLLTGDVLGDLAFPHLVGPRDVDLELEPPGHVLLDVGDVDVELLVPAAELVHGPVLLAQQRVIDAGLVLPDLDVLQEADPDALGELAGDPVGLVVADARRFADRHAPLQHERRGAHGEVTFDQYRVDLDALVVVVKRVDHVRRAVVGGLGFEQVVLAAVVGRHAHVGAALAVEVLRGDV